MASVNRETDVSESQLDIYISTVTMEAVCSLDEDEASVILRNVDVRNSEHQCLSHKRKCLKVLSA